MDCGGASVTSGASECSSALSLAVEAPLRSMCALRQVITPEPPAWEVEYQTWKQTRDEAFRQPMPQELIEMRNLGGASDDEDEDEDGDEGEEGVEDVEEEEEEEEAGGESESAGASRRRWATPPGHAVMP